MRALLLISLILLAGLVPILIGVTKSSTQRKKSGIPIPSFEEWIKDPINNQYLTLSKRKQYDMYLYWRIVEDAANENSPDILPQA